MNDLTLDDFLNLVKDYNEEELERVKKAYFFADKYHEGIKRASGEPYIIHPLNVAYILACEHADGDTLCAGLLHDVIEDTPVTKEIIAHEFNPTVAFLVDGVTNIKKIDFSPEEKELATIRKMIMGITEDARIILIKLADRLHNMRTLQFKRREKQIEKARETLEIYVPLAYYIGAYNIKTELEDLSFRYLYPELYKKIEFQKEQIEYENIKILEQMSDSVNDILIKNHIENSIRIRTKNIYGIYKKLQKGENLASIHDLLALKVIVDEVGECYRALGLIHNIYIPKNDKFKDYICDPKTNMYSSLHTTVFVPNSSRLVQTQIRTNDMDKIDSNGIGAYWDIYKGEAKYYMLRDLKEKFQFFKSLVQLNSIYPDDKEFLEHVKKELFSNKIYVRSSTGRAIELPEGSTVIDFAYTYDMENANTMIGAYVNNKFVLPNHVLNNKNRVILVNNNLSYGPRMEWEQDATKSYVRQMIKENKTELVI